MIDSGPTGQYLSELHDACVTTRNRAEERLGGLDAEQLMDRPTPGSWSAAECLEHMVMTDSLYLDAVDEVLKTAPSVTLPTFRGGRLAAWFIRSLEPDNGRRFKTTRRFAEGVKHADEGSLQRFLDVQRRLGECIERCRDVDIQRLKVKSPVLGLIHFRLGDALRLAVVHDQRHVLQAERAVDPDQGKPVD